jgi:hypothetical protein
MLSVFHAAATRGHRESMQILFAFFAALVSASHTTSISHSQPIEVSMSRSAPSRAEIAQIRAGSVYAGSGCISCRRTNTTSNAR